MNKDRTILKLAEKWFDRNSLQTNNNSTDFAESAVWCIKGALEDAYSAGKLHGIEQCAIDEEARQAAPIQRLCATVHVETANATVSLQDTLQDFVCVTIIDKSGMEQKEIHVTLIDNVELLTELFADVRVDVFVCITKMLAQFHTKTISWNNDESWM